MSEIQSLGTTMESPKFSYKLSMLSWFLSFPILWISIGFLARFIILRSVLKQDRMHFKGNIPNLPFCLNFFWLSWREHFHEKQTYTAWWQHISAMIRLRGAMKYSSHTHPQSSWFGTEAESTWCAKRSKGLLAQTRSMLLVTSTRVEIDDRTTSHTLSAAKDSDTGTRTRVSAVRGRNDNHLHHIGTVAIIEQNKNQKHC